jgi:hypothetical protein
VSPLCIAGGNGLALERCWKCFSISSFSELVDLLSADLSFCRLHQIHAIRLRMDRANRNWGNAMAKYGKMAGKLVERAVRREKQGKLRSGKGGKGGRVTSRKQAIAIGLSEARAKGGKVPKRRK